MNRLFASTPLRRVPCMVAALPVLLVLAACDNKTPESHRLRSDVFPMSEPHSSRQPWPEQPLFGSNDYLRTSQVMPQPLPDVREPLPPAVPLPQPDVQQIVEEGQAQSNGEPGAEQGGSNPASGMAAGITNAQGDGEKNQLDGGTSP